MTFYPNPKPEKRKKKRGKSFRESYRDKQRQKKLVYSYLEVQNKKQTRRQRLELKQKLQKEVDRIMGNVPKEKKKSISRLKKIADKLFSELIRRKYADGRGRVMCITCSTKRHWKKMQAGHYITRAAVRVRYDHRNVHPQCPGCNLFKKGAPDIYALMILKKYGAGILEELNALKTDTADWKRAEYMQVIQDCKCQLEILNK